MGDLYDIRQLPERLNAPAKLNLGLWITGRRADGYHRLESLFWPIDLVDDIFIRPAEGFQVIAQWTPDAVTAGQSLPTPGENLITRAANALWGDSLPNLDILIQKRIPIGGGLGGGSSNAGSFLRAVGRLPQREHARAKIEALAEKLGADVPFFLSPRPSWVTGIGESRVPIEVPPSVIRRLFFLVVVFPFSTLTADVFRNFQRRGTAFSPTRQPPRLDSLAGITDYLRTAKNDLEPLVAAANPIIAEVINALRETQCVHSGLTGSGSSCFAVYLSEEERKNCLKDLLPLFRIRNCKGIEAQTYTGD